MSASPSSGPAACIVLCVTGPAKCPSPLAHTQYYRPGLRRGSPPDDGSPGGIRSDHRTAAAIRALSQLNHCRQCPERIAQPPCPS